MKFRTVTVKELLSDISMGPFGSNIKRDCYVEQGIPYLNGSNLSGFKLKEETFNYVTEVKADSLGRAVAHRGDVIVTHRGTLGQIVYIPETSKYDRYVTGNSQFRLTCNDEILPEYLVYYFHSPVGRHKLLSNASQVGVPALARPTGTFQQLEIELPDIAYQKKVCSILSALEEKIECNERINENLAQQAQALYADIFITNADPAWPLGHLSDLITVRYGKDHKKLDDGPFPVYGSGGIMRYVERPIYEKESVLIPRKGTLNNVMYVNEPFWSVDTMFFTEMKIPDVAKFVFHFVKSKDLASLNAGSAVPSMTTDILNAMELRIPDAETLKRFESIVGPMYRAMQHNTDESKKLAALRDTLLPRLMSGELDVSELDL